MSRSEIGGRGYARFARAIAYYPSIHLNSVMQVEVLPISDVDPALVVVGSRLGVAA
jgi:hypothetical protein